MFIAQFETACLADILVRLLDGSAPLRNRSGPGSNRSAFGDPAEMPAQDAIL